MLRPEATRPARCTAMPPDLGQRLAHRRERRRELGGLGQPVEADDRELVRDPDARARWRRGARRGPSGRSRRTARRPSGSASRICANAALPLDASQSPAAMGPGSRPASASAASQPSRRSRASRHSSGPARWAIRRRPSETRWRVATRAASTLSMPIDGEPVRRLGLEEDDRRRGGRQLLLEVADVRAHLGRREDDPLHPVGHEELHDRDDVRDVEAGQLLEDDRVARRLGRLGHAVHRLGDAEVLEAGHDDAEHLRAPLDQAARDGAGLEPVLRDGGLDGSGGSRATRPGAC